MMLKTGSDSGFSMIEVMIAAAVLLLGTVMIHESYLRAADLFGRYTHSLQAGLWMGEDLWSAKEALLYSESASTESRQGAFVSSGKTYSWSRSIRPLSNTNLYAVNVTVAWNEGNRPLTLNKEIYAFRKEPG